MKTSDFAAIIQEHQSMVYAIAYGFFQDVVISEEIAQDVFLDMFRQRRKLKNDQHAKAWLRRTTTHRSIDVLRRRQRWGEVPIDDELTEMPPPASDPDPLMTDRLRRLVRALPEMPRAVVLLRFGEDLEVREIGEVLDMPQSTVRSHIRRSIAMLREKLSPEKPESSLPEEQYERLRT